MKAGSRGNIIRRLLGGVLAFIISASVMAGLLFASALIPRTAIGENTLVSAQYLCEREPFYEVWEGIPASRIDRYADSILLGIAYQYDSSRPVRSVLMSSWYHTEYLNENRNLLLAVSEGREANEQYLRYWHGSVAIVRPLLTFMSIRGMYALMGILLLLSVLVLFTALFRYKAFAPMAGLLFGLLAVGAWFTPLSLEYIWVLLLSMNLSTIVVCLAGSGKREGYGILFMVGGMATSFLDFLTAETLTLLIPLLLSLWFMRRSEGAGSSPALSDGSRGKPWITAASLSALWGAGYLGMWTLKWGISAVVLRENVMPYVTGHIEERLGTGSVNFAVTLIRNISCLFPAGLGGLGAAAGAVLLLLYIYAAYVYRKNSFDKNFLILYIIAGLIPYLRYIILENHSYVHYFFTYRAQLATVLAMILILDELVKFTDNVKTGVKRF